MRSKIFVLAFIIALMLTLTVGTLSVSAGGPHADCTLHRIRYGETLFSIGRLYGVNPYSIAMANNLYSPDYIQAGASLCIPAGYGYGYSGSGYGHTKVDGYRSTGYYGYPYCHTKVDGYRSTGYSGYSGSGYSYGHVKVNGYRYQQPYGSYGYSGYSPYYSGYGY